MVAALMSSAATSFQPVTQPGIALFQRANTILRLALAVF